MTNLEKKLLDILLDHGAQTRQELVDSTGGIPRTTIYNALEKLMDKKLVDRRRQDEMENAPKPRGRPRIVFYAIKDTMQRG